MIPLPKCVGLLRLSEAGPYNQGVRHAKNLLLLTLVLSLMLCGAGVASAKKTVRFASVSWTGVTIKTELAVIIMESLGYKASNVMLSVPVTDLFGVPIPGDHLKGIRVFGGLDLGVSPVLLTLFGGIHTLSDQGADFITPLAGHLQAHVGPLAQGRQLFLAVEEGFEPPELAAGAPYFTK